MSIHNQPHISELNGRVPLSIVIVNWNTRDLLEKCLESIRNAVEDPFEVLVVDNASLDGSAEMVQTRFPETHLIVNVENGGFAQANNLGISQSLGNFILLLNPDTEVAAESIGELLAFMRATEDAGAVGPYIDNPDGSLQVSCYPTPTLFREFWRLFHLDRIRPIGIYPMKRWETGFSREVDILLGACILLRRSALDRVGLLNESYFMYSEDLDICHRLKSDGWKNYWVPAAKIVHHGGRSTSQISRQMFLRLYQSKLKFFRIHYGPVQALVYRLILLAAALMRLIISPITWLMRPSDRPAHRELAHNYRQLIKALLTA